MEHFVLLVIALQINFSDEQYRPDIDCIEGGSNKGKTYNGTQSTTVTGAKCIIWNSKYPNPTNYYADHNFCRNNAPDNAYKPWCYTAVHGNYWEYCDIPYCECRLTTRDLKYNGTINTTRTGHTCKKWIDTDYKGEINNYCRTPDRSPDNRSGPWCYIDVSGSPLLELCNVPVCEGVTCPPLSSPHLVTFDRKITYRYGETAIITCEPGYRFTTQTLQQLPVTCQESGTWSGTIPTCEGVPCSELPTITNMETPIKTSRYRFPDNVRITCKTGYIVNETNILRCQDNGAWSMPTPFCIGQPCPPFPKINNTKPLHPNNQYRHPEIVAIVCENGYNMTGSKNVQCYEGTWTTLPKCLGVLCPPFPNINNTKPVNTNIQYRHPESITVVCENGYNVIGFAEVQCFEGTWGELPKCLGVSCPTINLTQHMVTTKLFDGYRYPDQFTFECLDGFEINGAKTLKCEPNGQWHADQPTCEYLYNEGFCRTSLQNSKFVSKPRSDSTGAVAAGIATIVAVLVLALVGVFVCIKRRNKRPLFDPTETNMYVHVAEEGVPVSVQQREPVYFNETGAESGGYYSFTSGQQIPLLAIKTENFYDYVNKETQKRGQIEKEFSKLKHGLQQPTTTALKPGNKSKNIYKDIYAYDESRVVLEKVTGLPDSDYINASFVSGPLHIRKYIASQGPTNKTVDDFWRMVWQYDCGKIVMLTNVVEGGKIKCMQYWPEPGKKQQKFGLINILLLNENIYSDFTLRTLQMQKDNAKKTVTQFHFTSWPDKTVPKYATSLVYFKHKVTTTKVTASGPIVVHCSAGIGRTGTFIALDYVVEQAKELGYVDVFACVEGLRTRRVNMVQTGGQYMFLHNAILETLMCPNPGTPTRNFPETFKGLMRFDDTKTKHKLFLEFKLMNKISPRHESSEFEKGKSAENHGKNRYSNIIPVESEMPKLFTVVEDHNDYINAVFLPGHRNCNAFIVTQMPLESTITDLWRLVYDYGIPTIVMLNQYNQTEGLPYWPETDVPVSFGPFCIQLTSNESTELFNCLTLTLKYKKEQRQVKLFQSTFWDEDDIVPKSPHNLFALMKEVEKVHDGKESGPLLVHCLNGCDKSGLYCVLATVIERLRIEQDVDIQYNIKQMRNRRPQIIPNYDQFKFLHEAVVEYLKEFDTYVNVK